MQYNSIECEVVDRVHEDAIRLFKVMMRLEFAIKEIGYTKSGRGQSAEIDWDNYVNNKLGKDFYNEMLESVYAEVLVKTPPKKQVVQKNGDVLEWCDVSECASVQDLMGALRRVRNNLFHGGKSGDPDSDRNEALYAAALFVVDKILEKDADLKMAYVGEY